LPDRGENDLATFARSKVADFPLDVISQPLRDQVGLLLLGQAPPFEAAAHSKKNFKTKNSVTIRVTRVQPGAAERT
jgi:hypothetical protein